MSVQFGYLSVLKYDTARPVVDRGIYLLHEFRAKSPVLFRFVFESG